MSKTPIKHQNFFVIRTPRMPIESALALGTTREQTKLALANWIAKPEVKEAIYLASPSLLERIEQSTTNKKPQKLTKNEVKQQQKLNQALLKYMIRMCTRPTPFGLFSGIHMGQITNQTAMLSNDLLADERKTRLDLFYLCALKEHFLKHAAHSEHLKYYPNSSHYFIGEHCRYIEAYQSDEARQYRLSAIESDEHFCFLLDLAKNGLSFNQLVSGFLQNYSEAEQADVSDYVQQLIDESILLADIPLPLTGDSPDSAFVDSLTKIEQKETAEHLSTALNQMQQMDNQKQGEISNYRKVFEHLNQLPVKAQENKLFQTDVYRSFSQCELDQNQLARLLKQLKLIKGVSNPRPDVFSDLITRFNQRFEGQFVPIDTLLDEESGLGFSNETGYEAPLLAGLQLRQSRGAPPQNVGPSILDNQITQAISLPANRHKSVIQLNSKTLAQQLKNPISDIQLPTSFAAIISLYQDTDKPIIKLNGCYGPSAANLLGRFCHLDEELKNQVINHLDNESNHSPEVIFAEIIHMPEGRPGNVIARPHLRQYEIVFLADSSKPSEFQIPLNDLFVWVESKQVKLWSKRLKKQIVPRLSCAHNYSSRSLGAYRFLSMVANQQASAPNFSLPTSQANASFVPRIMLDNLILSEKIWRIPRTLLVELLDKNSEINTIAWQRLKDDYQLDDHLSYRVHDNVLQLNLTNPVLLEILLAETRGWTEVELKEVLTSQFETPVKSAEGYSFANELIIPFLNPGATVYQHYHDDPQANILAKPIKRRFSPGSQWLSLKIYSGNTAIDTLLAEHLLPLIEANKSDYEKWFFIRYGDPQWHIRLRFYGEPKTLCGQLLPKLNQLLDPMIEGNEIHKAELFTYEREVERYGGPDAMALIETLFMVDSLLIAKTAQLEDEVEEDLRWRVALLMTDQLMSAFAYTAEQKLSLISNLRAGFGKEFNDSNQLRKQLGTKFKTIQNRLNSDFKLYNKEQTSEADDDTQVVFGLINNWYQQANPVIQNLLELINSDEGIKCTTDTLLSSILHMHNNRMFKAYGREHELIMHDFLRRYYFSADKR